MPSSCRAITALRSTAIRGDYTVAVTPLGPPDPAFEHEPNDSLDRSQPIALSNSAAAASPPSTISTPTASHSRARPTSTVALDAPPMARLRLSLRRPTLALSISSSPHPETTWRGSGMLPAGDYQSSRGRPHATTTTRSPSLPGIPSRRRTIWSQQRPRTTPCRCRTRSRFRARSILPTSTGQRLVHAAAVRCSRAGCHPATRRNSVSSRFGRRETTRIHLLQLPVVTLGH